MLNVGLKNFVPEKFPRLQHQTISLDIGIFFNGTFNGATTLAITALSIMTLGITIHITMTINITTLVVRV